VWGGDSVDTMTAVLRREDLVVLGELASTLRVCDPLCGAIVRSPLAPQLFRLDARERHADGCRRATLLTQRARCRAWP